MKCNNTNSRCYNNHFPSMLLLLVVILLLFVSHVVVVLAQIPDVTTAASGGGDDDDNPNNAATVLDNDDDDHNVDDNNGQPEGMCISSSSNSISLLGSYSALSEKDMNDIITIGGSRAHVYGEMTSNGFRQFASYVNLTRDDIFLDLGSGIGSLVIQAAVEFGVKRSIGVELSISRHEAAIQSYQKLKLTNLKTTTTTLDSDHENDNHNNNDNDDTVTFIQGDAASPQIVGHLLEKEATVVWISNLLFDDILNQAIINVIEQYAGSKLRVIVCLKPLRRVRRRDGRDRTASTLQQRQHDDDDDIIKGFELQPFKVPFEMSWTAGIHNDHHHHHHHQSSWNIDSQQQQQQQQQQQSSSSPGHYCSILLRRQQ